jgi:hypothetical protein
MVLRVQLAHLQLASATLGLVKAVAIRHSLVKVRDPAVSGPPHPLRDILRWSSASSLRLAGTNASVVAPSHIALRFTARASHRDLLALAFGSLRNRLPSMVLLYHGRISLSRTFFLGSSSAIPRGSRLLHSDQRLAGLAVLREFVHWKACTSPLGVPLLGSQRASLGGAGVRIPS